MKKHKNNSIQILMKHFNLKAMALAMAGTISMSAFGDSYNFDANQPWPASILDHMEREAQTGPRNSAVKDPSGEYDSVPTFNYVTAPDGSTWFYRSKFESEIIVHDEGFYTWYDEIIKSFTFTIYDSSYNEIGTIHDDVVMAEDEVRAVQLSLESLVTDTFFNSDPLPEIMIYHAMNTTDYRNRNYYKVYSLGGEKDEKGNDKSIMRWEGRGLNTLKVKNGGMTEYYIAFTTSYDASDITVYKRGEDGEGPVPILEYVVPDSHKPGDTTYGTYYLSKEVNGQPYFIFSKYEKQYFVNPEGSAMNDEVTPDNSFIIDVFTLPNHSDNKAVKVTSTKIPLEELDNSEDLHYVFYSIGSFMGNRDVDMSVNGTPESPAFLLTKEYCLASNPDTRTSAYEFVDTDGKTIRELANDVDGVTRLPDIAGQNPQAMFVELIAEGVYVFHIIDLYTGEEVATIDQQTQGRSLTSECARIPYGKNDYKYAFGVIAAPQDVDAQGNDLMNVAWFNSDGSFDRLDTFNIGPNVMYTSLNWSSSVLNPYLFDTDEEMEYAVLVKRTDPETQLSYTEYVITDGKNGFYATFNEEDGKGAPYSFSISFNETTGNKLQLTYHDEDRDRYNITLYDLPFAVMSGGTGTAEDPYQIATPADLQFVKDHPEAHYVVTKDFDAAGYNYKPVQGFAGSLDGQSHTISNLEIGSDTYTGIFGNVQPGAKISNLTLIDPNLNLSRSDFAGVVAGMASGAEIKNINVYNATVNNASFDGIFGGLAGQLSNESSIETSQVFADINLPSASAIGGVVGSLRTGSKVTATAFGGNISGATEIGGIVGSTLGTTNVISDCHVDANIVGKNTIGGIVGSNTRSTVTRTYVEGTLTATQADANDIIATGGVVGSLSPDWEGEGGTVVSNNIVALKSITAPAADFAEDFAGQKSTVHRIVGYSTANEAEEILDETTWEYSPGDPLKEEGLANNYALASLQPSDKNVEIAASSVEGQSVDAIDRKLLDETLGFKFGENVDAPWHKNSSNDPWLYFESTFIIPEPLIRTVEEEVFNVDVRFLNPSATLTLQEAMNDLVTKFDESVIEMTGNGNLNNGILSIEFKALKEGSTPVEITINGQTAAANVFVAKKTDSVESIIDTEESVKIAYRSCIVSAEGATIEVYSSNGMKVLAGRDEVSVSELGKGIYVVVATDHKGNRSTLKIAR